MTPIALTLLAAMSTVTSPATLASDKEAVTAFTAQAPTLYTHARAPTTSIARETPITWRSLTDFQDAALTFTQINVQNNAVLKYDFSANSAVNAGPGIL